MLLKYIRKATTKLTASTTIPSANATPKANSKQYETQASA